MDFFNQNKNSSTQSFYDEVKFVQAKNKSQSKMMDLAESNVLTRLHQPGEEEKKHLMKQGYFNSDEKTMNEPPAIFKKIIIDPGWKPVEVF